MMNSKPRILAIDDSPANLLTLGAMLAKEFDLQIATSGASGLALAAQCLPDLILLDIMMPEMDGFECCRRLKEQPQLQHVPVIFVSALSELEAEAKGLALGAADYIVKPINVPIARQRIRNLLERERLRREVQAQVDALQAAQVELRESESRFRNLFEKNSSPMLLIDPSTGLIDDANDSAQAYYGYPMERLVGMPIEAINTQTPQAIAQERQRALHQERNAFIFEHRLASGELRDVEVHSTPIQSGKGALLFSIVHDITQRRQAEKKLLLAASVFVNAREGITITDAEGLIVDVNDAFSRITGYSRAEVLGLNPSLLNSGRQGKEYYAAMWASLVDKGHWYGEIWNRRKNGEVYAEMQTISAVRDEQGVIRNYVALFSDITVAKEHQKQLEHVAHFDALTSLPNRVLLADRLRQGMARAQRNGLPLAVVYLDLDGFKAINDRHGHKFGDQLLIALSARMKQALREGDTLARIGGDEFVSVMGDLNDFAASLPMLGRLLAAAASPVAFGDVVLQVSASLGVTFYPQEQEMDADQLLRQADQAMYQAKLSGKNRYRVFDAEHDSNIRGHHESLENIRRALAEHEFVLHYQPKVNMRTGAVIGAEALIRWQHPSKGLLLPGVFLPVTEDHPLAIEIGEWVIDTALSQLELWHAAGLDIPVSVNVGARQLQQSNFADRLQHILAAHDGMRPGCLEIEVLETSALEDMAKVSQIIRACRAMGVKFALDDFGTGYSSLIYLKQLPVAVLKIDQSFVRDMLSNLDDLAILEGVLGLAAAFRREIIAEGVESLEHGEMLLQLGCEQAQGYGIARPMPGADLPAWALAWRPDPSWLAMPSVRRDDLPLVYAAVDHRAWISALEKYFNGDRTAPRLVDQHQCRFGRWLDGRGLERFGDRPVFQVIERLHARVHGLVAQLMELSAQGQTAQVQAQMGALQVLRNDLLAQLKLMVLESRR
jgi:diguanylate cyclase (GGDEF)-like protein/PAS domain S-box-containing protein